jgi:methionine sulfoxide reductase heme-binding subunit
MWRRYFGAGLIAIAAVVQMSYPAAAAVPASPADVSMRGQGIVVGSQSNPQLRLKFNAADGSSWLLEIAVNPVQNSVPAGNKVINLGGIFTLGFDNNPLATGTASGVLNPDGSGDIKLVGSGATSLDVNFAITTATNIAADAKGQWPAIPGIPADVAASPVQPANHFFWYLSRTAGLVAYLLFFTSICFGLLMTYKQSNLVMAKWQSLELHQFLALSGICFLILHILSLLGDKYFNFTIVQLLLPVNLPYRPIPVTMGIVVFWAALVIFLVFQSRKIIGRKVWRLLHPVATVLFFGALLHAILAGTDTSLPCVEWMYVVTAGVAVFAIISQFSRRLAPKTAIVVKSVSYGTGRRETGSL